MRFPSARGGVLSAMLVGVSIVVIGGAAILSTPTESSSTTGAAGSAPAAPVRRAQPREIAAMLGTIGLDAQTLAAAGVSGAQCDAIFEAAGTYCFQADRIGQFQLATRNLNAAKARATKFTPHPENVTPQTVDEAQTALDNLKTGAQQFVTSDLGAEAKQKIAKINANRHWGLPVPYLVVDRTNVQWLALRGALANKHAADQRGRAATEQATQVIAAADANATVAQAKTDFESKLAAVKQSWNDHSH